MTSSSSPSCNATTSKQQEGDDDVEYDNNTPDTDNEDLYIGTNPASETGSESNNINKDGNNEEEEITTPPLEEEVDEEGLLQSGYDVVICGTGLIQSILASALARAGRSVLHCDGNDFYGELDAVLSLGSMMEWSRGLAVSKERNEMKEGTAEEKSESTSLELNPRGGYSSLEILSIGMGDTLLLVKGMEVVTPYGPGMILDLPTNGADHHDMSRKEIKTNSLAVKLHNWTMADGQSPVAYFGYSPGASKAHNLLEDITSYYAQNHDIIPKTTFDFQHYILSQKRGFALDLTPGLLYANASAVEGMVASGVSEYCEFKSVLGLYLLMEHGSNDGGGKTKRSRIGNRIQMKAKNVDGNDQHIPTIDVKQKHNPSSIRDGDAMAASLPPSSWKLSHVPCSKGDVFSTKLLSPVEKRRLMKFLQLASDYAIAMTASSNVNHGSHGVSNESETSEHNGQEDTTFNDTDNEVSKTTKTSVVSTVEEEIVTSVNERQLHKGRSLSRPQNKIVSTNDLEVLQQCIQEGMDFDTFLRTKHNLPDRLRCIVIHAMALSSRVGTSDGSVGNMDDSYSTEQGMKDLCQHLLSLGHYGGTAFLVPLYGAGELSQAFCRSAAVHGGTYLLRRSPLEILLDEERKSVSGIVLSNDIDTNEVQGMSKPKYKNILSKHVVVSSEAFLAKKEQHLNGVRTRGRKIIRRISILRGKLLWNGSDSSHVNFEQRHVIIVPPNTGILGNSNAIHGVALDDSVNIAPPMNEDDFKCTVLHLTTTVDEIKPGVQGHEAYEQILERTILALIQSQPNSNSVKELYQISFCYDDATGNEINSSMNGGNTNQVEGLHVCSRKGQSITVEAAFSEARDIFEKTCPGVAFLSLSEEMDKAVKERKMGHSDDDDDEGMMLKSAMNMLDSSSVNEENK